MLKFPFIVDIQLLVKIRITPGPGAAKKWEEVLLGLGVEGSQAGIDGEEIAPHLPRKM